MPDTVRAYLGLGSNIGDSRSWLRLAVENLPGVVKVSPVYQTAPVGGPEQDDYLNIVVAIETSLRPRELLELCLQIENTAGRQRVVLNGPRTLDIDVLIYGEVLVDEPGLQIPHPRMFSRNFVTRPLFDIQPELAEHQVYGPMFKATDPEGLVEKLGDL